MSKLDMTLIDIAGDIGGPLLFALLLMFPFLMVALMAAVADMLIGDRLMDMLTLLSCINWAFIGSVVIGACYLDMCQAKQRRIAALEKCYAMSPQLVAHE